jgi:hypothetical protein
MNWTERDGRSNASELFQKLAGEVARLLRGSAHDLINGNADSVARLVVAQLAHVHKLGPMEEEPGPEAHIHEQVATGWGYTCDRGVLGMLEAVNAMPGFATACSCEGTGKTHGYLKVATADNDAAGMFCAALEKLLPPSGGWALGVSYAPRLAMGRTEEARTVITIDWHPDYLGAVERALKGLPTAMFYAVATAPQYHKGMHRTQVGLQAAGGDAAVYWLDVGQGVLQAGDSLEIQEAPGPKVVSSVCTTMLESTISVPHRLGTISSSRVVVRGF